MLRDIDHTVLEGRRDGEWVPEVTMLTSDIAAVYERLTEVNGARRWVLVNPGRSLGHRHSRSPAR